MIATVKVDEDPVALYVRKFRSVCDMHSVRFGSPDNFGRFMQQLVEDRKFAMDFWALAGRFSSREGGELTDEQMLEVIVHEIAGSAVTAVDGGLKQQVDSLARMIAGEDVQSPVVQDDYAEGAFAPPAEMKPPSSQKFSSSTIPSPEPSPSLERAEQALEPDRTSPPIPEVDERVEDRITGALDDHGVQPEAAALTQHQLDEALLRLELNSLELKLHLDNIDSRMSRMEPHLEELASKVSASRERVGRLSAEPERVRETVREHVGSIHASVGRAVEKSRLVLEPQPVPMTNPVVDDDDPSIPIPLAGYSQRRFSPRAGLFAALLLVGVGGFFFLHRQFGASLWTDFGPSLRERYDAALHELHGVMKGNAADESKSAESEEANQGGQAQAPPVASAATEQSTNRAEQSTNEAEQSTNVAPNADNEPQAAPSRAVAHSKHKSYVVPASVDREMVATSKGDSVSDGLEAPVSVAPGVMEENLVMSRVPAYPEAAKADRVEGPVVMQAIISKNGTVGHLHVIQGDPKLRGAASEAVSKWRYRPYIVNGRPVEVATTVTVDFKLNR